MGNRVRWFFENPENGELAIAQWPNPPLAVYLTATAVRVAADPDGTAETVVSVVGVGALLVWAGLELIDGESPFRRVLGGVVFAAAIVGVINR